MGVILSIRRPCYKFIDDHSNFAPDAGGKAVLRALHTELTKLGAPIPWLRKVSNGPAI